MPVRNSLVCWELLGTSDPVLDRVRALYESTQAPGERIPWEWLQRSVGRRNSWRPGAYCPHLLVTADRGNDLVSGFAYGGHVPDYGGYVCYLGVDPAARRRGAGTRLFEQFFRLLAVDAAAEGTLLPFVIWESRRPGPANPPAAHDLWAARLRLFERVGGRWLDGVEFLAPDFEGDGPPVPLQLFLKPVHEPAEAYDEERLRAVVRGLHQRIYRQADDSELVRRTLPPEAAPRLRPASAALRSVSGPSGMAS